MHFTLPSRLALVTAGCALASAVFWGWSRGLPEPNWESSASPIVTGPTVEPASQPVALMEASPAPKHSPEKEAPMPDLAQTEPEPIPSVPPTTPTPEPSPVVVSATPAPETPEPVSPAEPTSTPMPIPVPQRPSDDELAGPLPERSPGETVVAPAPPARLEIDDIARQPRLWPPQVLLLTSQRFPVVIKGVNVGNVQVPAGRPVVLRKVNANGTLEIEFQGSPARVKAQATDLVVRATALAAAREKAGGGY